MTNRIRKIINDPVYGFITIDDPLVFQVIAHPWYQRLRRIHQMAFAHLVYPGAVHTRLHHSLGAYHLMCNALTELKNKGVEITPEEEKADPNSIWNFYRQLIQLRNDYPVLASGGYQTLSNNSDSVYSFLRYESGRSAIVTVNLSAAPQSVNIQVKNSKVNLTGPLKPILGNTMAAIVEDTLPVRLEPFAIHVWATEKKSL